MSRLKRRLRRELTYAYLDLPKPLRVADPLIKNRGKIQPHMRRRAQKGRAVLKRYIAGRQKK